MRLDGVVADGVVAVAGGVVAVAGGVVAVAGGVVADRAPEIDRQELALRVL